MPASRNLGCCAALAVVLAGGHHAIPSSVVLASPSPLTLNLRMIATQELPALTRAALMSEAQSIWNDGYVRLKWVNRDDEAEGPALLQVLVMARAVPPPGEESPWTVGELVRRRGADAVAIASITGARRIVDETRFSLLDAPATVDHRLGIVLGRAVAHEIGHYLLQTSTHAPDGLMRARIDPHEFADLRRGSFRLDKVAGAHLAALAAAGTLTLDPSQAERFSYE
jgi:hypothetical protein